MKVRGTRMYLQYLSLHYSMYKINVYGIQSFRRVLSWIYGSMADHTTGCAEGPDERLAICHAGRASWFAQILRG